MGFYHVQPVLKKGKKVIIYMDDLHRQWVGTNDAMYLLYDLKGTVNTDDLLEMMNVDPEDRYKYFTAVVPLPYTPVAMGSEPVEGSGIPMFWGDEYQFFFTRNSGIICVLDAYLKPLRKLWRNNAFYVREHEEGTFLEVYYGTLPLAVIRGENLAESATFMDVLEKQTERLKAAHILFPREDEQPKLFEEGEDPDEKTLELYE